MDSKPLTEKTTQVGSATVAGEELTFAVSAMQGFRSSMEDSHLCSSSEEKVGSKEWAFFGVFDGHCGAEASQFVATRLTDEVMENEAFRSVEDFSGDQAAFTIGTALRESFLSLDAKVLSSEGIRHSGSTAISIFVTPTHYVVANCGDSRLIIVGQDEVLFGTEDHKPSKPSEEWRILHAGGFVIEDYINGRLGVARAFGDCLYKQKEELSPVEQLVIAEPEVACLKRSPSDQFILLACDGIWDTIYNDAAANFVLDSMRTGLPLDITCEMLLDKCLVAGSRDNLSSIIVKLPGAPPEIGTMDRDEAKSVQDALRYEVCARAGNVPPFFLSKAFSQGRLPWSHRVQRIGSLASPFSFSRRWNLQLLQRATRLLPRALPL